MALRDYTGIREASVYMELNLVCVSLSVYVSLCVSVSMSRGTCRSKGIRCSK